MCPSVPGPTINVPETPPGGETRKPVGLISLMLLVAVAAFLVSLGLPWHHRWVPAVSAYRTVYGIDTESWLIAGAALSVLLVGLLGRKAAGFYSKSAVALVTFAVVVAIVVDYIDWQSVAATANSPAYFGPGFYVALGGMAALVIATVVVWRRVESW